MSKGKEQTWEFQNLKGGHTRRAALKASWEVSYDPISDDYTPEEIEASDLFKQWIDLVRPKYPNELIPIYWTVMAKEQGVFESMPFQYDHPGKDFLSYFSYPVNSETGEQLNWLTLPVVDKLWNSKQANKGGFIQEATRWKPSILQPYVYLPALTSIR